MDTTGTKTKLPTYKTFKDRWENILTNASLDLLDTTIDYHKHCIQDTQYKLQHRIDELKKRCDDNTAQKLINKTDTLYMKYTERSLLALNKTTKRLKRLENTSTRKAQTANNRPQVKHTKTKSKNKKTGLNYTHTHHPTNTPNTIQTIHTTHAHTSHTPQTSFHGHIQNHMHTRTHNPTNSAMKTNTTTAPKTLQTQHTSTPQHPYNYSRHNNNRTLSISPFQPTNTLTTPLMQVQTANRTTQPTITHITPTNPQTPKLRIPPRSQPTYNTQQPMTNKTNNMQQHNRTPTPTNTHNWQHILLNRQNPQHNTQTSNIPHNITQNVQSQIHYFLLNQTHKHKK